MRSAGAAQLQSAIGKMNKAIREECMSRTLGCAAMKHEVRSKQLLREIG